MQANTCVRAGATTKAQNHKTGGPRSWRACCPVATAVRRSGRPPTHLNLLLVVLRDRAVRLNEDIKGRVLLQRRLDAGVVADARHALGVQKLKGGEDLAQAGAGQLHCLEDVRVGGAGQKGHVDGSRALRRLHGHAWGWGGGEERERGGAGFGKGRDDPKEGEEEAIGPRHNKAKGASIRAPVKRPPPTSRAIVRVHIAPR